MVPIIFCFILGERREVAMARTHLALAFAGGGTQLFTRPHRIGCENNSHRNITMTHCYISTPKTMTELRVMENQ